MPCAWPTWALASTVAPIGGVPIFACAQLAVVGSMGYHAKDSCHVQMEGIGVAKVLRYRGGQLLLASCTFGKRIR